MQFGATGSRVLCSELVCLKWKDDKGVDREITGDLEAISRGEAWLQLDAPIPAATPLRIGFGRGELKGVVQACTGEDWIYDVTVLLDEDTPWSRRRFTPKHLLDPTLLVVHNLMHELRPQIASIWKLRAMTA